MLLLYDEIFHNYTTKEIVMSRGRRTFMSQFSKSLRDIRIKSGKKQREAAEYLGLNIRTYQYYEGGQSEPNISTLIKLADFFMVSLDELVGRD